MKSGPQPSQSLPYPGGQPYPNPLFADSDKDYDRDVLTLKEEYDPENLFHLNQNIPPARG